MIDRSWRMPFCFLVFSFCLRATPQAICSRPTISDEFLSWIYLHPCSPVWITQTWFNLFLEHVWSSEIIPRDRETKYQGQLFYHLFVSRRPSTVSCYSAHN